ncbi:TPA: hypothetical protein JLM44_004696 [Escherichia coli]|nr:hypothetical protein [Escherichia coli]
MKKTLIALTVAASAAVSGSAMAVSWVDGGNGQDINFGGTITAPNAVEWMWSYGGKTDFDNKTTELTDSGKKLVITADKDIPIFLGKMKHAAAGSDFVPTGTMPTIEFLSSGAVVTPVFSAGAGMSLTIKAFDRQSAEVGTLTLNGRAVGTTVMKDQHDNYLTKGLASGNYGDILKGALCPDETKLIMGGKNSTVFVEKFGGPALTELEQQIRDYVNDPGATFTDKAIAWNLIRSDAGDVATKGISIAYAYGIEKGQTLEANFTAPVTSTTTWKAPLTVSITYN